MKKLLSLAPLYKLFNVVIGANKERRILSDEYIKSDSNSSILDLGCGNAEILSYLEFSEYTGIDFSVEYINQAKKQYAKRTNVSFCNADIIEFLASNNTQYDIVLLIGVMHHMDDDCLRQCLKSIRKALSPQGKLVTLDGCIEPHVPRIAKTLLNNDRGEYVRTKEAWIDLFLNEDIFSDYAYSIRNDLLYIPYNHIIFHLREE